MVQITNEWFSSKNPWKARSAIFALIPVAGNETFHSVILEGCETLLTKSSECTKDGAACALLALSYSILNIVHNFLSNESNLVFMTTSGLEKCLAEFRQDWKETLRMKRERLVNKAGGVCPIGHTPETGETDNRFRWKPGRSVQASRSVLAPFSRRLDNA